MRNILRWNAELARNMWLELSPQRLIVAPGIFLLIIALIAMNAGNNEAGEIVHYVSLGVFGIFGTVWGLKNAADSILDEYNDKTWDWQRMSIIGPWKLAWGKLFGSTIYNWYIAMLAMVVFLLTAFTMDEPVQQIKLGLLAILMMMTIQGLMILFSLMMLRRGDGRTKIRSNRIFILGIILVFLAYRPVSAGALYGSGLFNISWYGIFSGTMDLALINAIFYGGWVVAGLYRSMRAELQFTDKPVWWVMFILSSFVFQYGYVATSETLSFTSGMALTLGGMFLQTLGMMYLLALLEPKDIINFRLLQNTFRKRDFNTFFRNIPLWLITLPISFLFGILTVIFLYLVKSEVSEGNWILERIHSSGRAFFMLIAIFGFVIRDLGILLLLSFSTRSKRASGAMAIYLVVLYLLLPMLMRNLNFGAIFYPDPSVNNWVMILFPLAEAGVVTYFLWDRWKNEYASVEE